MDDTVRVYPTWCRSAYCGRYNCSGCANLPVLQEFKDWVRRTRAVEENPVWSPGVYVAHGVPERRLAS